MSAPGVDLAAAHARALALVQEASRPQKRSFSIRGHRTSISLETSFWSALHDIASARNMPLAQLVAAIDEARGGSGLSGAVRVYILAHIRQSATESCIQVR